MTTFVALLRAVNVGSANRIKMDRLRAACVAAGYTDAATYIQTGNIILTSTQSAVVVRCRVERLITDEFDMSISAVIRTANQMTTIANVHPLDRAPSPAPPAEPDIAKLFVVFLAGSPSAAAERTFAQAAAMAAPDDEVLVDGSEVYVRYAIGAGTTRLTAAIWNKLGVPATARNWNVTRRLAELGAGH
ncbi:MAG: DUF1697 domain-containing protein [Ilumatobacteraceae bacterium]